MGTLIFLITDQKLALPCRKDRGFLLLTFGKIGESIASRRLIFTTFKVTTEELFYGIEVNKTLGVFRFGNHWRKHCYGSNCGNFHP